MADLRGMAAQLATQSARVGWYFALTRLMERQAARHGGRRAMPAPIAAPVPTLREMLADLGALLLRDATAVRDGIHPPGAVVTGAPLEHLGRVRAMLADLPRSLARHRQGDSSSVRALPETEGLPEYIKQDFHFQSGGYLTADSARVYDVQVETLFMGAAGPMRRQALRPIADHVRGRDQRRIALLDVACGTGRFLRQVRLAFPAMRLTGLDLSQAYLDEARAHLADLRPATLIAGNGEATGLPDASQDIVTTIFLFHELPPDVRRRVAAEMARVLQPGGILVFMDSLQRGDRPGWDGLLEAFPNRFHEPYFRHYTIDDLDALFTGVGLVPVTSSTVFLAKLLVWRKVG